MKAYGMWVQVSLEDSSWFLSYAVYFNSAYFTYKVVMKSNVNEEKDRPKH